MSVLTEYANFRDPVGLLRRMIASRDSAARAALVRAAAAVAMTPLDLALLPFERRRIRAAKSSPFPVIFIVGPPRSGTTLAYQVLARVLPVTYFNNLTDLFPRSPLSASLLFNRWLRPSPDPFHSFYGNTAGLAGPNDAFHVWNRWLGTDRYEVSETIGNEARADMRRFFDAWLTAFDAPLLNKNNRNTACVGLLGDVFPNAYFIEIRRDPVYVAQSLVVARERVQGSRFARWGLGSYNSDPARGPDGYLDDVCRQVFGIDMALQAEKRRLGLDRFVEISYERLCADPAAATQQVYARIWHSRLDEDTLRFHLRPLPARNEITIDSHEFEHIQTRMSDLYGHAGALGA